MKSQRRVVLGLFLLLCATTLAALYAGAAYVVTVLGDTDPIGRARGLVYLSGLIAVPGALVLGVIATTLLIGRSNRRR